MYLIGSSFIIETDHQPLLSLFNNPHSRPPMRIERWLLYLQQFDFKLMYCPGNKNAADYLSRHMLPLTDSDTKTSEARSQVVHHIIENTVPKAITLAQVQEATGKDPDFYKLIPLIQAGNHRSCKANPELAKYAQVFQELSYMEGIILRGHKILIPKSLQQQVIDICHGDHLGIVKTKQLLRSKVWFPGIDKSVERRITNCIPCQASINTAQRQPLKMSLTPKGPWLQASADFCGPFPTGETILVVIDAYSRYPEVEIIKSTAAKEVLPAMERIFATHGIPETLKSDNGSPFQRQAFRSFAEEKGFKHQKIIPLWPEANGHAEGFMKNIDKVARTAHSEGKDWRRELYSFLGNYVATPHPCTGKTLTSYPWTGLCEPSCPPSPKYHQIWKFSRRIKTLKHAWKLMPTPNGAQNLMTSTSTGASGPTLLSSTTDRCTVKFIIYRLHKWLTSSSSRLLRWALCWRHTCLFCKQVSQGNSSSVN